MPMKVVGLICGNKRQECCRFTEDVKDWKLNPRQPRTTPVNTRLKSKFYLCTETIHGNLCITVMRATTISQQENTFSHSVLSRMLCRRNGRLFHMQTHLKSRQSTSKENGCFSSSVLASASPCPGECFDLEINIVYTAYMAISSSNDRGDIAFIILRTDVSLRHHNHPDSQKLLMVNPPTDAETVKKAKEFRERLQ